MRDTESLTGTERVQEALRQAGADAIVVEMPTSTRTAQEAAATMGCAVDQIAKSLIFRGANTGRAILIVACGSKRVDEDRMAEVTGERLLRADADFVRETTGYAIGGVPPLGHRTKLSAWMDSGLLRFDQVWAAAGSPRAVFRVAPADLARIADAAIIDL